MALSQELLIPLLASNAASSGRVGVCAKWPNVGRAILGLGFLAASGVNLATAILNPQSYVEGFGPNALPLYRELIDGPFAQNPARLVIPIAVGQAASGALSLLKDPWARLGLLGEVVFLLAITPLGLGSGFPAPLILVGGLSLLLRRKFPTPVFGLLRGGRRPAGPRPRTAVLR